MVEGKEGKTIEKLETMWSRGVRNSKGKGLTANKLTHRRLNVSTEYSVGFVEFVNGRRQLERRVSIGPLV